MPFEPVSSEGQEVSFFAGLAKAPTQFLSQTFPEGRNPGDVPYKALIGGMVAQGHGIEAICLFLSISKECLLQLTIDYDLLRPHDRPLRRGGGPKAWTEADYRLLLAGWLGNWKTRVLADQLHRSRGSIWSKTRRMGLPRRQRDQLVSPSDAQLSLYGLSPAAGVPAPVPPGLPGQKTWSVTLGGQVATFVRKRLSKSGKGGEIDWVRSSGARIVAQMFWAGMKTTVISQKTGISFSALTSRKSMIGIPKLETVKTANFDPAIAAANIARMNYVERPCRHLLSDTYWGKRGERYSRRHQIWASRQGASCAD